MSKRKRMIFPVMRKQSIPVTTKVKITGPKRRYTLLPSPSQSKTSENSNYLSSTSTPIPVRLSHSASHITHSPITHSPITHSPITHSPPQVFQRPYQASPIRAFRQTKEKGKPRKKPKVRRVEIFRPRKSDLRPKAQTQVQIKKNKEKSKKLEMQKVAPPKNQPQQKLKMYKSIKVETGTVNLQVCHPMCNNWILGKLNLVSWLISGPAQGELPSLRMQEGPTFMGPLDMRS